MNEPDDDHRDGVARRCERDEARASLHDATLLVERIDQLHQPDETGRACNCGTTWPCKTRRALDGFGR